MRRTEIQLPGTNTSQATARRAHMVKAVSPAARSDSASTAAAASMNCQAAESISMRRPTARSAGPLAGSAAKGAKSRPGATR